jgi:hypothetical protein
MAVASSGNILFSSLVGKAEGTAGTSPSFAAGGRKFLVEPTGLITVGKTWDLGEGRSLSLRNPIVATTATLLSTEPELSVSVPAVSIDELSIWLGMATGPVITGASSPYTWTYDWAMGTANNGGTSYSFISYDAHGGTAAGGNAYLLNYCLPRSISINADRSGLTSLSADLFAQNIAESTAVAAAATAVPVSKFMSGRLWSVATGTALASGTFTSYNYALDLGLTINTGIQKQAYLAGTTVFSTHAESDPFGGELTLTVQSNAAASLAWYQSLGSQKFVRLSWTDGTFTATIYTSIIVSEVSPISGSEDGLTTMSISGTLAYDPTSGKTMQIVIANNINALP